MMTKTFVREAEVPEKTATSYTISYYRLTVVDKSGKCSVKLVDELFDYFKSDMLEWRLNRLRKEHKRLETSIEKIGTDAKVVITKRSWFQK